MQTKQNKNADRNEVVQSPVKLRGHHFLCLLTYKGLGYTAGFVENMSAIAREITAGRAVQLCHGPDDICNALSADDRIACDHDCAKPQTLETDRLALEAVEPLLKVDMSNAFVLTSEMIALLRHEFAADAIREGCARCRWKEVCDDIADSGFAETRLFPGI